jgi:peptidoglycan/xylan/chitin deacetylase (PgdA/CDA1 family)
MPSLTLTFDNGPVPGATDRILDILRDRKLPASFFVVGEKVAHPGGLALVERSVHEGHQVGNHTMHHLRPLGEFDDPVDSVAEIAEAQSLLAGLAEPVRLFRPPGKGKVGPHLLTTSALDYLTTNGFTVVTWNAVPGDWLEPRRQWFDKALLQIVENDWSVLVLHDHCQIKMLDLFEDFLDWVQNEGIEVRSDFPSSCLPIVKGKLMVDPALISN